MLLVFRGYPPRVPLYSEEEATPEVVVRRPPDRESRSGTAAADQKLVSLHLRFSVLRTTYVGRKESIYLLNFERERDPFLASYVFKMIKVFA